MNLIGGLLHDPCLSRARGYLYKCSFLHILLLLLLLELLKESHEDDLVELIEGLCALHDEFFDTHDGLVHPLDALAGFLGDSQASVG